MKKTRVYMLFLLVMLVTVLSVACGSQNEVPENVKEDTSSAMSMLESTIAQVKEARSLEYTVEKTIEANYDADIYESKMIEDVSYIKQPYAKISMRNEIVETSDEHGGQDEKTIESYANVEGNSYDLYVRTINGEDSGWRLERQYTGDEAEYIVGIETAEYDAAIDILSANIKTFRNSDEQSEPGIVRLDGTFSVKSVNDAIKKHIVPAWDKMNWSEEPYVMFKGVQSMTYAKEDIPVSIWIHEGDDAPVKVQVEYKQVEQAIRDEFNKLMIENSNSYSPQDVKIEKATYVFTLCGLDTFEEIEAPSEILSTGAGIGEGE